jgi:hypothetical protein
VTLARSESRLARLALARWTGVITRGVLAVTQTLDERRTNGRHARTENGRHEASADGGPPLDSAQQSSGSKAAQKMRRGPRVALGCALLLFTAVVLAHLTWAWSIASRLVPDSSGVTPAAIRAHWLGVAFTPTLTFTLLLIVALSAMAGSTAATAMVFSNRAGYDQLEKYWVWWYLLRPGVSAVVAVVAYVAVKSGFLGTINDTQTKGLAFAAALGGLTGLFTDKMLEKLQKALGLSPFTDPAAAAAAASAASTEPASTDPATAATTSANGDGTGALTIPEAVVGGNSRTMTLPIQPDGQVVNEQPIQTDNRPIPADGDQDVDQEPTPVPGSPTGEEGV